MTKPKLTKQVCEIRYERGYRYLDRCGDVLVIFEELLPDETGKTWMAEEVVPSGSKLKCPELEVKLAFDATKMIVDQEVVESEFDFPKLCMVAYSVLSGRFDLGPIIRAGCRRFFLLPTDSTEEAEKQSVRLYPLGDASTVGRSDMRVRSVQLSHIFETADQTEGVRFSVYPSETPGAPETADPRLMSPARLLPKGQKEALMEQLRMRRAREKNPVAGVMLDVDYYWVRPTEPDLKEFFNRAMRETERIASDYLERRGK